MRAYLEQRRPMRQRGCAFSICTGACVPRRLLTRSDQEGQGSARTGSLAVFWGTGDDWIRVQASQYQSTSYSSLGFRCSDPSGRRHGPTLAWLMQWSLESGKKLGPRRPGHEVVSEQLWRAETRIWHCRWRRTAPAMRAARMASRHPARLGCVTASLYLACLERVGITGLSSTVCD